MKSDMTKTKKTNIHLPLVVAGYILFSLLVIGTLVSTTIPFGILLFNPRVLHFNVAVTLFALTVGAVLPVFTGYIIGDRSVKTKSKLSHHFTGILFGLLAYWIMILLGSFIAIPSEFLQDNRNARMIVMNLLPAVSVGVIATILSVAHVRSRYVKQDILMYRPFSISLIVSIVILPVLVLVQNVMINSIGVYSFVPLIIVAVSGVVSYVTLHKAKLSANNKVVWSAVSISLLFVAMYVSSQFSSSVLNYLIPRPTMETQVLETALAFGLALVGWIVYWSRQVKALR